MTTEPVKFNRRPPFRVISQMLEEKRPLYIRNIKQIAKHNGEQTRAMIALEYYIGNSAHKFVIPRTNFPFDLADEVNSDALLTSKSFRDIWNAGALELVSPEEHAHAWDDEAQVQSYRRSKDEANNTERHRAPINERAKAQMEADEARANASPLDAPVQAIAAAVKAKPAPKSSRLTNLEIALRNDPDLKPRDVISMLSDILGDLVERDLENIATNALFPIEAQDWARERRSRMLTA